MIGSSLAFIAGALLLALSFHVLLLYLGRLIVGIGIGLSIVGC